MAGIDPVDAKAVEKHQHIQVEDGPEMKDHVLEGGHLPVYDDKNTAKLLRKVDLRLLPMLTTLYLLSYLDRGNIGNARVAGMNRELNLTDKEYNLALTILFIPYALFEVPSNIVLKVVRPSTWMSILVVCWGGVMVGQGFVQNFKGLFATRFFLGLCESGFFPAASYLVGEWYCRFETQWRMSIFFSAASLAGAFSGLLAFALAKMDGIGGQSGWRWIFIIEGLVTIVIGASLHWTLPDSPTTAKFLSSEEKEFLKKRLEEDSGTVAGRVQTNEKFQWSFLKSTVSDWKIWFTVFICWGNTIPLYAFVFTAPVIILQLGYTAAHAQLLTIPVYLFGTITTLVAARLSDRRQSRWPFIVIPYSVALVGFIGVMAVPRSLPGLTYAFLFLITGGIFPAIICVISWVSNNLSPTWRRAIGLGITLMMANFGGAIGSNIYLAKEAPTYWTGYGVSTGVLVNAILCTFVLRYAWKTENEKRDRMSEEEIRARYSEEELLSLGDRSPLYRYVL